MKRTMANEIAEEAKRTGIANATAAYTQQVLRQMRAPEQPKDCPLCMDTAHIIESCPIEKKCCYAQEKGKCLICLKTKSHPNRLCRGLKPSDKLCDKMECDISGPIHNKAICPMANTPPIANLAIGGQSTKKTSKN